MILFGLFNFLGKYSLNQFALSTFLYFICFCLFLLQGHRFLGKTHQRIWYENASTGTGHLLLLIGYFLSNTKFDFDHNVHEHRLLAGFNEKLNL